MIFTALQWTIFIEVILSWVYPNRTNQYIELLHTITGPLLIPGKKIQDKYFSNTMVDFSPIIALFIIMGLRTIVLEVIKLIF